jgi:hypothetical protein
MHNELLNGEGSGYAETRHGELTPKHLTRQMGTATSGPGKVEPGPNRF